MSIWSVTHNENSKIDVVIKLKKTLRASWSKLQQELKKTKSDAEIIFQKHGFSDTQ